MSTYTPTIGLEIHAELKTATKMFCSCLNNPDEGVANKNVCAVCLAHPGTLPVMNKDAVAKVVTVGRAIGGTIADFSEFDRKNYFYPDIPKAYQISQYKYPLVSGGALAGVRVTRIHLEEDTARSQHEGVKSLVDYNRAGVPLMELVTEPDIHDAQTAGAFAKELQLLLRALDAGEANLEKGEMRVEANISVSADGTLGTKVEVKNLNSFRSVERAIAYEVERQTKLIEEGGAVVQETRGWDEVKQQTFSQRKKESSHDYRYFPDPDLPKLLISETSMVKVELPELPAAKRARYRELGLKADDADMFASQPYAAFLFDTAIQGLTPGDKRIALTANYVANDLAGNWNKIEPAQLAVLINHIAEGVISSRGAKDAIAEVLKEGGDLVAIASKYFQQSDAGALAAIAQKVIEAHPSVVADYKAGKEAAMQFLVGQGMKESRGSANPQTLRQALQQILA